jgi:hypothetical protein
MKGTRNCVSLVSRFSQCSGLHTVATCGMAKIIGSKPEMGSPISLILISQSLGLKLQPRNGTLSTFSPTLKGLGLLEQL